MEIAKMTTGEMAIFKIRHATLVTPLSRAPREGSTPHPCVTAYPPSLRLSTLPYGQIRRLLGVESILH